jgi:hypothetical protein
MARQLEADTQSLPQCEHCDGPVEAMRYTMCKKCWWDRDIRNENSAAYKGQWHEESYLMRRVNIYMEANNCGLDEARLNLSINDLTPIELRSYCTNLLSKIII